MCIYVHFFCIGEHFVEKQKCTYMCNRLRRIQMHIYVQFWVCICTKLYVYKLKKNCIQNFLCLYLSIKCTYMSKKKHKYNIHIYKHEKVCICTKKHIYKHIIFPRILVYNFFECLYMHLKITYMCNTYFVYNMLVYTFWKCRICVDVHVYKLPTYLPNSGRSTHPQQ